MKQRALLVGLGGIGWRLPAPLETHYQAIKQHAHIDFAGGVDTSDDARREFQQATGALVYADLASALTDAQPSIVTIATPPSTHADLVCQAAAHPSVKGIVCEKPMAESVADCRRMIAACADKALLIGHQRRYEQRHRLLRAFLRSEALGRPVAGVCRFSGGYLNNGTHAADAMRFLLDDGPWRIEQADGDTFAAWISTEHGSVGLHSRGNMEPGYLKAMYNDLLECMDSGKAPECSGDDGLEAVRLALIAQDAKENAA